jgi:hypothetical protein
MLLIQPVCRPKYVLEKQMSVPMASPAARPRAVKCGARAEAARPEEPGAARGELGVELWGGGVAGGAGRGGSEVVATAGGGEPLSGAMAFGLIWRVGCWRSVAEEVSLLVENAKAGLA